MGQKHPTTITSLEMRAPPARAVAPPALPLAIIRAHKPTLHFYRYLYDTVGAPHMWVERHRMTGEELSKILEDEQVEIYVVHIDGVPAGFGELDFRESGTASLAYFGLIPEFVGRGIGPYFLYQLISMAWSRDIERMAVNTCTLDHPSALPLYQKFGFEPISRRDTVIEVPDGG
ncbi:MAG: GNAT family N-acetyltransferase [Rhizobiales bacterium]|nr:GNAT family N-acetyltransferase [Hyphomicrobiales bacterium]